jgi:hypothetical protein
MLVGYGCLCLCCAALGMEAEINLLCWLSLLNSLLSLLSGLFTPFRAVHSFSGCSLLFLLFSSFSAVLFFFCCSLLFALHSSFELCKSQDLRLGVGRSKYVTQFVLGVMLSYGSYITHGVEVSSRALA